jgi:hypothetical protein
MPDREKIERALDLARLAIDQAQRALDQEPTPYESDAVEIVSGDGQTRELVDLPDDLPDSFKQPIKPFDPGPVCNQCGEPLTAAGCESCTAQGF